MLRSATSLAQRSRRGFSSSSASVFRQSSSANEWWSFLPILNITRGLPIVYHVNPKATVFRAIVDMVKMRSGSLIVSEGGKCAGIITERDILDKMPFEQGASRKIKVTELMTPRSELISANPSFTLDECVKVMEEGVFRHLPIMTGNDVKAVISMRDIAIHVASALSKAPMSEPLTVASLMEAKGGSGFLELSSTQSVVEAVLLMRQSRAGSVIVHDDTNGFGILTERDYLTKAAVYDEESPRDVCVADIMTQRSHVKSVAPTGRIDDCLSLMVAGGFRHLPVVTPDKQVVGLISMQDILHYFLGVGKE